MGQKGLQTRQLIMDQAQAMILDRGYGGTSVDQLIKSLGLTKGAFFHHFNSKNDLATCLIQRYVDDSLTTFTAMLDRARKLSDDPLQQLLILIGLYAEDFEGLEKPYEGCLMAAYVYELQQFDDDVRPLINTDFLHWRKELSALLKQIVQRYPPRTQVDLTALADMFLSIFEGAFVLSKSLGEPDVTTQQLKLYRTFIQQLFAPAAEAVSGTRS